LSAMAADLVRRQVVTSGTPATLAAKAATAAIPIVFGLGSDPVELGLVASLNRPGGVLTGVTTLNADLAPKRLQLLHEMVPTANPIAVLVNPMVTITESQLKDLQAAARTLGVTLRVLRVSTEAQFDAAISTFGRVARRRVGRCCRSIPKR
jgi:putative ABC transport system substrate-binding protein